ncbi:hypothetical protein RJ641_026359 [Dillenia turbinata]|uniref:Uncharacterized protein n=1 Tax=Dillenia turbinata TaxID=194707 RepID=A0AAN8ZPV0_9MAGN
MAESEKPNNLHDLLKPFYDTASEAEDRLSRLESALGSKKDAGDELLLKSINDLQAKLKDSELSQVTERQQAQGEIQRLAAENQKLQYRITHLVRALNEADRKLEKK